MTLVLKCWQTSTGPPAGCVDVYGAFHWSHQTSFGRISPRHLRARSSGRPVCTTAPRSMLKCERRRAPDPSALTLLKYHAFSETVRRSSHRHLRRSITFATSSFRVAASSGGSRRCGPAHTAPNHPGCAIGDTMPFWHQRNTATSTI